MICEKQKPFRSKRLQKHDANVWHSLFVNCRQRHGVGIVDFGSFGGRYPCFKLLDVCLRNHDKCRVRKELNQTLARPGFRFIDSDQSQFKRGNPRCMSSIWSFTMSVLRNACDRIDMLHEMLNRIGLDLNVEYSGLNNRNYKSAILSCLACSNSAKCRNWLDATNEMSPPPLFCPNAVRFEKFIGQDATRQN